MFLPSSQLHFRQLTKNYNCTKTTTAQFTFFNCNFHFTTGENWHNCVLKYALYSWRRGQIWEYVWTLERSTAECRNRSLTRTAQLGGQHRVSTSTLGRL